MTNNPEMNDFEYFRDPRDVQAEMNDTFTAADGKWAAFMEGADHADQVGLEELEDDAANEIFFKKDREHARDDFVEEKVREGIFKATLPMDDEDIKATVLSWVESDRRRRAEHKAKVNQ